MAGRGLRKRTPDENQNTSTSHMLKGFNPAAYGKYTDTELEVIHWATRHMLAILSAPTVPEMLYASGRSVEQLRAQFHPEPYLGNPKVRESHWSLRDRPSDKRVEWDGA